MASAIALDQDFSNLEDRLMTHILTQIEPSPATGEYCDEDIPSKSLLDLSPGLYSREYQSGL